MLLWLRMDEEEINNWYEEQKQKCMDEYLSEIEKNKLHEEAERKYEEKLSKIMEKYSKLMEKFIQDNTVTKATFFSKIKDKIKLLGRK